MGARSITACVAMVACGCGRLAFTATDDTAAPDALTAIAPLATYPLDEGSGQTVSGAPDGVLGLTAGSEALDPQWVPGRFGSALAFDAADDIVSIAYTPTGYFQTGINNDAITVAAWVQPKTTGTTYRVVFEVGGESNGATLGLTDAGRVRFVVRNLNGAPTSRLLESTSLVEAARWYYLAGTNDAAGMHLYVYDDAGAQLDMLTTGGPFAWRTGSDGIAIGNSPKNNSGLRGMLNAGPEPFDGIIDEVRIYDVAIDQAQIEAALAIPAP